MKGGERRSLLEHWLIIILKEAFKMFTSCAGIDVLAPYTLVKLVDEYFKDSDQQTIYIDTKVEPFKSLEDDLYKHIHEDTIQWNGWYLFREGAENYYDQKCIKPLSAGFERILIDEFSEYSAVDILCRAFIFNDNDFESLETIADLEKLLKKYRKIIKGKYRTMMKDLCDIARAYA